MRNGSNRKRRKGKKQQVNEEIKGKREIRGALRKETDITEDKQGEEGKL